jgi:hypothetical protein
MTRAVPFGGALSGNATYHSRRPGVLVAEDRNSSNALRLTVRVEWVPIAENRRASRGPRLQPDQVR